MSGAGSAAAESAARLENRVDLRAVLDHLPGALESRRHHKRLAGAEAAALAAHALQYHPAGGHHAQLVLTVADLPLAARGRPAPAEELLTWIGEIVAHLESRLAYQQPVRRGFGSFRVHRSVESDDRSTAHG